ncbi:UvrB/UvrC motif-containing protein [Niallia alba]|uniref:UvrB/UvrC motif-containing protein n=1 Tax=Niallia alba TaxID=2729105 RepID=UPI0029049674|nr:UvrB/UvrC motif-containing protein [Niallia nealsonii]MED3793069.1 UvrB/UvrC motif-containing protein [Niallia alba]
MELKEKIKNLPTSPGVYLMKDSSGHIIYVGKSKKLKNRVSSYFQHSKNRLGKVEKLVKHIKDFDFILTDTEFEALMLECKLIKEIQPMYNRMMKTTKAYNYIVFRWKKGIYHMEIANEMDKDDVHYYFGPFTSKGTVENVINGIKAFYKMDCSQEKWSQSPCLNYSIGKCMGICFDPIAKEAHQQIIHRLIALFNKKSNSVLEEMSTKMIEASSNVEFEKAAEIRDTIAKIKAILQTETVIHFMKKNQLIIAAEYLDDFRIKVFFIRRNEIIDREIYIANNVDRQDVVRKINSLLSMEIQHISTLEKEEMDEAYIIYKYLNSGDCKYTIISQEWNKNMDNLWTNLVK